MRAIADDIRGGRVVVTRDPGEGTSPERGLYLQRHNLLVLPPASLRGTVLGNALIYHDAIHVEQDRQLWTFEDPESARASEVIAYIGQLAYLAKNAGVSATHAFIAETPAQPWIKTVLTDIAAITVLHGIHLGRDVELDAPTIEKLAQGFRDEDYRTLVPGPKLQQRVDNLANGSFAAGVARREVCVHLRPRARSR